MSQTPAQEITEALKEEFNARSFEYRHFENHTNAEYETLKLMGEIRKVEVMVQADKQNFIKKMQGKGFLVRLNPEGYPERRFECNPGEVKEIADYMVDLANS